MCTVYCVLCTVYCVLCTVYHVLCTVHCVLCTVYCVLCTVYSVMCTVGTAMYRDKYGYKQICCLTGGTRKRWMLAGSETKQGSRINALDQQGTTPDEMLFCKTP